MQVEFTGRQVAISPVLKQLTEEGLARVAKIVGDKCTAHVVLNAEKYRKSAEITVQCRKRQILGACESPAMETALREALSRVESQALRHKDRQRARKRLPKEEKAPSAALLPKPSKAAGAPTSAIAQPSAEAGKGVRARKPPTPVTVHSPAEGARIAEPHVVHSRDSVARRPMTLEEAVKEAEQHDKDVFVFRNNLGALNVLHRRRDGAMELIEAP